MEFLFSNLLEGNFFCVDRGEGSWELLGTKRQKIN